MGLVLDLVVLLLSWGVVAQHIQATRGHFVSDKMAPGAMLLAALVIGTTLVFSVLLFFSNEPLLAASVGVLIELASLALFYAAIRASSQARLLFAFDPGMPHGLVQQGPYRYVRHPFYSSYLLFWIGWAIAIWSLWTLPFVLAFIVFYTTAARGEEAKFASTELADRYARYRRSAGLFWPKLPLGGAGRSVEE